MQEPRDLPLHEPQWARLTYEQLRKDADLSGLDWPESDLPIGYAAWIDWLYARLSAIDKQGPELLSRFLYRVDLPEKEFLRAPFPSRELAEAVLRRAFLKVWLKAKYRP